MVAVSPTSADIQPPLRAISRFGQPFVQICRPFVSSLPGEYTVAKTDAFDRFRRKTTPVQVMAILFLTPVPCLLVHLILESIPLNDPATGLHGCLPFLLRNVLTATGATMTPFLIKADCIPQLPIQSWKLALGFGLLLGAISTGTIATMIVIVGDFPVASSQFLPLFPMGIIARLIEYRLFNNFEFKPRLEKVDLWLGMVVAPILVYPIFTAVFMALKPSQQLWFSLLLPVIKLLLQRFLWLVTRNDLDLVATVTCTIGHFYHVLFTAMCLQNAKSLETLVAVVVVNTIHMLVNCREILRGSNLICTNATEPPKASRGDIISTTLKVAQTEHICRSLHFKTPSRFASQYPRYQGVEFVSRHRELLAQRFSNGETGSIKNQRTDIPSKPALTAQILPVLDHATTRNRSSTRSGNRQTRQQEESVRSLIATLFQMEFILLRSYITVFGLSFYALYLMIVFWLPNRPYFVTMTSMTTFDSVKTTVLYLILLCILELLFLGVYLVIIRRSLGISGIYQLAFVLWSQRVLIQGKLIMLSLMILGFPLEHYGNGFIFVLHTGG